MFGYSKDEVVRRNGRMFQGHKTNRERLVMEIHEAILEERAIQISLLNYRKDGTPFWMLFHMCSVSKMEDRRVIHFVGVQVPILWRKRLSGYGNVRNDINVCEDGAEIREAVFRCCRREVYLDSFMELGRALALNSAFGSDDGELEVDGPHEASEVEKTKARAAFSNILSILTHYSELTRRVVCGKRWYLPGMGLVNAVLNLSLSRIKQSFVFRVVSVIPGFVIFIVVLTILPVTINISIWDILSNVCRTDPCLPDMPIVYASDAILMMTGYAKKEVLGSNYRFFSGLDTDPATKFQLLLSPRKDKPLFSNFLRISPVPSANRKVAYFAGIQNK